MARSLPRIITALALVSCSPPERPAAVAPVASSPPLTPLEARLPTLFSGASALVRSTLAPRSDALPSCTLKPRDLRNPADRDGDGVPEDLDLCPDVPEPDTNFLSLGCRMRASGGVARFYELEMDFAPGSVAFNQDTQHMIATGFQLYMSAQITGQEGPYIELQGLLNKQEKGSASLLARRLDATRKALALTGIEPSRIRTRPTSREQLDDHRTGGRIVIEFAGMTVPSPPPRDVPPTPREPAAAFPPCRFDDVPSPTSDASVRLWRVLRGDTMQPALVVTSQQDAPTPPLQLVLDEALFASVPPLRRGESALVDLSGAPQPLTSEVTALRRPNGLLETSTHGFIHVEYIQTDTTRWRLDPAVARDHHGVAHPRRRGFRLVDPPAHHAVLTQAVVVPFGADGVTEAIVERGRVRIWEQVSELPPEHLEELARLTPSLRGSLGALAALRRSMVETRAALDRAISSRDLRVITPAAGAARLERQRFFALLATVPLYTATKPPPAPWPR